MQQFIKDFLFFEGPKKNVIFSVDGKVVRAIFKVGWAEVLLKPLQEQDSDNCIDVVLDLEEKKIDLSNYYYDVAMNKCPSLPHEDFFNLLDVLASILKMQVSLIDESSKQIKPHSNCKIKHFIMALAKGQTFYNRYGFTNAQFQAFLDTRQKQKLIEFSPVLNETFQVITGNLNATLRDVANFVLENCHTSTYEKFISSFSQKVSKLIDSMRSFNKDYSETNYDVRINKMGKNLFQVDFISEVEERASKTHKAGSTLKHKTKAHFKMKKSIRKK